MTSRVSKIGLLWLVFFLYQPVKAEVIQFAEDELPTESVVPKLDTRAAVLSKLVTYSNRLEAEFVYSSMIDEMFYSDSLLGIHILYHSNEVDAFGLRYLSRMSGLSSYADQFKNTAQQVDLEKAPKPESILTATYRWSFLYGKVSLSKALVLPTIFSIEFEGGLNKVGSESLPLASVGMTQKFFLMKHLGVALSYRLFMYQTLDPTSANIGVGSSPDESSFDKVLQMSQCLDLGISYLF